MITFVALRPPPLTAVEVITVVGWNGARYEGRTTRSYGRSALCNAARELIDAGCPDDAWQMVGPEGDRRLFGGSVHRLAKLTVGESDKVSARFIPYVPFAGSWSERTRPPEQGVAPPLPGETDTPRSARPEQWKWPAGGTEEEDLTEAAEPT
jgi:hypothetical protein